MPKTCWQKVAKLNKVIKEYDKKSYSFCLYKNLLSDRENKGGDKFEWISYSR